MQVVRTSDPRQRIDVGGLVFFDGRALLVRGKGGVWRHPCGPRNPRELPRYTASRIVREATGIGTVVILAGLLEPYTRQVKGSDGSSVDVVAITFKLVVSSEPALRLGAGYNEHAWATATELPGDIDVFTRELLVQVFPPD